MTAYRAVGLLVTFDHGDDLHRYATGQRDRTDISWRRVGDTQSSGEQAPIVAMGPAPGSLGRAVIHPVPMESEVWGTNEDLVLYREDHQIGTATVAWVYDTNQGLQPNELRLIIHWTQAGGQSPFS